MARMALRQHQGRALGDGWLQPRWAGRWTTVGNLDGTGRGLVDPSGLVTVAGATWSLDWWIGAEDRWHVPCREVAVRQSLVSTSPVVETRLRVPGGDAVHRAYAARAADGTEALVVEVENASSLPVALALAVRPHTQTAVGRIDSISLDGSTVRIGAHDSIRLPRPPGRTALAAAASGDSAAVVFAGEAGHATVAAVSCPDGLAQAALLFPLAHTATLRVALALDGAGVDPDELPSATQVASGWAAHARSGCRIVVPDRRLRDAVAASTRHLLLVGEGPRAAAALDLMGFPDEAARLLDRAPPPLAREAMPGLALHAIAQHWELTRDAAFAQEMVDTVATLVARAATATPDDAVRVRRALPGVRDLLSAAGEARAARDVATLISGEVAPPARPDLTAALAGAGSTWTWSNGGVGHDPEANAAVLEAARSVLIEDRPDALALCPVVADAWRGQGWELHDAPTRHGRVSYAVRWQGDRPAILWERRGAPGRSTAVTAPGLDPSWSSGEPSGEALLAPVEIPERPARRGVTIPVVIEPTPRHDR